MNNFQKIIGDILVNKIMYIHSKSICFNVNYHVRDTVQTKLFIPNRNYNLSLISLYKEYEKEG